MQIKLDGIPETLLIPLWAKAVETAHKNSIIKDNKAVEMVSNIDYDFSKFEKSWMTQVGVSVRTMLFDNETRNFLKHNPDAVVINLGAGLDTRIERFKNDDFHCWYDLDVPESIELRSQFFSEGKRHKFIAKSMLDFSWMDDINFEGKPVLIIAEGLFMYFREYELKPLFKKFVSQFNGAEILFEMLPPAAIGKSKHHESLRKLDKAPEFKWGLKNCQGLEIWDSGIKYIEEWDYYDYHKARWKLMGFVGRLPFVRPNLSPRIVHMKFV